MNDQALTHGLVRSAARSVLIAGGLSQAIAHRHGTELTEQEHPSVRTRTLRYRYTVRNTTDRLRRDIALWVYAPLLRTSFQHTASLDANAPYSLIPDNLGNRLLQIETGDLPPFASRIVEIRATLDMDSAPRPVPLDDPAPYLSSGDGIEVDHPGIRKVAARFRQQPPLQRARDLYGWVVANLRPSAYRPHALGAARAFETRSGDCTEFAQLYAALARAAGLPARVLAGYRHRGSPLLRGEDLHNWAEIHLDGAWRVVDPHARRSAVSVAMD